MRRTPVLAAAFAAFTAVAVPAAQAPAEEMDLDRAVALALERNPALMAVAERRREVAGGIREAKAEVFPELAFVTSNSRSRNPSLLNSPDFEQFLDQIPGGEFVPAEQVLYDLALEVKQAVYTWGRIPAAIRLSRLAADVTAAQIATAELDVALAAAEAYYNVLASRRSLATVEIQLENRREALAVVQARYDIGEATRLELLQARSALAEVEPVAASARGDVEVAEQQLRSLLDLAPATPIEALERSRQPASPPALGELMAAALAQRPELRDLDLQQEALVEQQAITLADLKPQVDFFGSYGRQARLPENLDNNLFQNWSVSLTMRWDFFDGGRRQGQAAQLESQRRQLELQHKDLLNQIRLEIEQARTQARTAVERWQAAEAAAEAAREASRVAAETYREGVALQADVLDAQQRETLAELTLVQAYYDTLRQAARLDRAVGLLPGGAALPARAEEEE